MILLRRKFEFQTASQSEIDFKMANRSKYSDFNFVVEYPIWVSIKRTLTGKLAVAGQNSIYCVQFLLDFFLEWKQGKVNVIIIYLTKFLCLNKIYQKMEQSILRSYL